MKTCARCKENKPLTEFSRKATAYHSFCKGCRRAAYQKTYRQSDKERTRVKEKNRLRRLEAKSFVNNLKAKTPCADCGKNYPSYVMDFDHLDRATKFANVAFLVDRSTLDQVRKEIAKCEIVCANCHRERTWGGKIDSVSDPVLES